MRELRNEKGPVTRALFLPLQAPDYSGLMFVA